MTYLTANLKPDWLARSSRDTDITDLWLEATDPSNERGEVCLAHFEADRLHGEPILTLIGITIQDTTGKVYRDREWTMKVLGYDAVCAAEQYEMEC